ncbi:MAG: family acetyltransferase [Armatimonadetes bacterium]|jgi:GNAT superfamily N-acetyltransferase|nr:family acetyltransferase [Armatimonadota bacterium]
MTPDTDDGIELMYLADRPEAVPVVARWYFDEWGYIEPETSYEQTVERLGRKLNRDRVPLTLLAVEGDAVLGAAALKIREMSIYPEREYWIGGVFVHPEARGRGIASALCRRLEGLARAFGIRELHLQTERLDGGLYGRLGWKEVEQIHYCGDEVLVMEKSIHDGV